jgi:hypothetical protein
LNGRFKNLEVRQEYFENIKLQQQYAPTS